MESFLIGWLVVAGVLLLSVAAVAWFAGAVWSSMRWQQRLEASQRLWVGRWREERTKHDALLFAGWQGVRAASARQAEKAA